MVTMHVDFQPVKECKHHEWTYGELCVKCGECGRFEYGGASNPVHSEILLMEQGYDGYPPLWRHPERRASYYKGKWWKRNETFDKAGKLSEAMPQCWHRRELEYVRWWLEGRNY